MLAEAEHAATQAHTQAELRERTLRQIWRDTQARLSQMREQLTVIERAAREAETRLAAVTEARERAQEDLLDAHERLAEVETTLDLLIEDEDVEPQLEAAQAAAAAARSAVMDARAGLASLEREARARAERNAGARTERDRWAARTAGADKQIATLRARLIEAETELKTYDDLPELIDEKRQKLLNELSDAERQRKSAADKLAAADNGLRRQPRRCGPHRPRSVRPARRAPASKPGSRPRARAARRTPPHPRDARMSRPRAAWR